MHTTSNLQTAFLESTMEATHHRAASLDASDQRAYMALLTSVLPSDGHPSSQSQAALRHIWGAMGVTTENQPRAEVLRTERAGVESTLEKLRGSDLRYTLLTDLLYVAYADHDYNDQQRARIHRIAERLGIDEQKLHDMETYVRTLWHSNGPHDPEVLVEDRVEMSANAVAAVLGALVPFVTVANLGGLFDGGLWGLAIMRGLAVLGLGLGAFAGFLVAVALGCAVFFAVRWLALAAAGH